VITIDLSHHKRFATLPYEILMPLFEQ